MTRMKAALLGMVILVFCVSATLPQTAPRQPFSPVIAQVKQLARDDVQKHRGATSPQTLKDLYLAKAAPWGMSLLEIKTAYDEAYEQAIANQSLLDRLTPTAGWGVAIVLALIALFRETMASTFKSLSETLRRFIYSRWAGAILMRSIALKCYRASLLKKYARLTIPFQQDLTLDMRNIYVPLEVEDKVRQSTQDAVQCLAARQRVVILGPPGSGKSVLLRNVAFRFALRQLAVPDQPIPILLELNRFNVSDNSVEQHLRDIMEFNDFPNADQFLAAALRKGRLLLLFDGLDEVNSANRANVVQQLRNFLNDHQQCRAAITCRNAVYHDDFVDIADATLRVMEFNDLQVRRFLNSWHNYMPHGKTVEQLITTLRDRPRIMALARNPLLLTMIAFLYKAPDFVLPSSRAEFYDQAIDVLLRPKGATPNTYSTGKKRLVLQHLALFNQDSGSQNEQDRRTIEIGQLLSEVQKVLPELNLKPDDAQPLVDEIVERSGLLLMIDGDTRCQFAHLTLQEFFSAVALEGPEVVARFTRDHDAWRETVKLWCGLDRDCTEVVRSVHALHAVTGFECLADAQKILPILADQILSQFKSQIGEDDAEAQAILTAFGAVASDARPRGVDAFQFLVRALSSPLLRFRQRAAQALSLTNLPGAATALLPYLEREEVRDALIRLGDVAVPVIAQLKSQTKLTVLLLGAIGTPQAAMALIPLLDYELEVAIPAAWHLAALIGRREVEDALRMAELPPPTGASDSVVWFPFEEPSSSIIPLVMGRCAQLIAQSDTAFARLDRRIAIPLTVRHANSFRDAWQVALYKSNMPRAEAERLLSTPSSKLTESDKESEVFELMTRTIQSSIPQGPRAIIESVDDVVMVDLFRRLVSLPTPTIDDWKSVTKPTEFIFEGSPHARILEGLIVAIALLTILNTMWKESLNAWIAVALASLVIGAVFIVKGITVLFPEKSKLKRLFVAVLIAPVGLYIMLVDAFKRDLTRSSLKEFAATMPIWGFLPALAALTSREILRDFQLPGLVAWWLCFASAIGTLVFVGLKRERAAQNPLKGILATRESGYALHPGGNLLWPARALRTSGMNCAEAVAGDNEEARA